MTPRVFRIILLVLAAVAFAIAILDPNLLDIKWEPTGLLLFVLSMLVVE